MSIVEKLNAHQEEMFDAVQNVQELVGKTRFGTAMLEKSAQMAASEEMNALMAILGNEGISEEERLTLSQYMGEIMKSDITNGMAMFAEYLKSTAEKPEFASRTDYYLELAKAAQDVNNTKVYQEYIVSYKAFEEDKSPEADAARKATEEMQAQMRKWAEI